MIDILQIICDMIKEDANITLTPKIGFLPDTPNDLISIMYNDGNQSQKYLAQGELPSLVHKPRVKITVRAFTYSLAWETCMAIKELFKTGKISNTLGIFSDGDIMPLGQDENKRTQFEIYFNTIYLE